VNRKNRCLDIESHVRIPYLIVINLTLCYKTNILLRQQYFTKSVYFITFFMNPEDNLLQQGWLTAQNSTNI